MNYFENLVNEMRLAQQQHADRPTNDTYYRKIMYESRVDAMIEDKLITDTWNVMRTRMHEFKNKDA